MSEIAEHLNSKLAANAAEQSGESVDLDNLFAFLSDVQTSQSSNRNHIIDQIGEQMDELVEDLDVEVNLSYSHCIFKKKKLECLLILFFFLFCSLKQ